MAHSRYLYNGDIQFPVLDRRTRYSQCHLQVLCDKFDKVHPSIRQAWIMPTPFEQQLMSRGCLNNLEVLNHAMKVTILIDRRNSIHYNVPKHPHPVHTIVNHTNILVIWHKPRKKQGQKTFKFLLSIRFECINMRGANELTQSWYTLFNLKVCCSEIEASKTLWRIHISFMCDFGSNLAVLPQNSAIQKHLWSDQQNFLL